MTPSTGAALDRIRNRAAQPVYAQVLRRLTQVPDPRIRDHDEVLDPHPEPARHVNAGLDRDDVAGPEHVLGGLAEPRRLVDLQPDAVAQAVAVVVAVAGRSIGSREAASASAPPMPARTRLEARGLSALRTSS